jgi:hypothetical protein
MHVTVQPIAPVTEVTDVDLAQIVSLVRHSCAGIAPFAVTAGRAEAWELGIVLPDPSRLPALNPLADHHQRRQADHRHQVRESTGGLPPAPVPRLRHRPCRPGLDPGLAHRQLRTEVPLPVIELVLVAQQYNRREIIFRVLDRVPLAG